MTAVGIESTVTGWCSRCRISCSSRDVDAELTGGRRV